MIFKKETWCKTEWTAALVSFIFGIGVHLFALVNTLSNFDDISTQPAGYGTGITSGRWFLTIIGDFGKKLLGNHNLPLFNGVIFIALLAVSVGLLISTFGMKRKLFACISGMLFMVFPAAVSVMLFRYTAIYYGIAILLAVAAAWILPKFKLGGFCLSSLFTALALGIYQAYLPLTVAIMVLALIRQALAEDQKFWQLLLRGVYACASIILGLVLYFVFSKLALQYYGKELSTYQGIDSMGALSISRIPELVWRAVKSFFKLPFDDYCNLAQTKLLKLGYVFTMFFSGIMVIYTLLKKRKKLSIIALVLLMGAAFPIASNLIVLMCPDSRIYTLMIYGFAVLLWVPAVLLETLPQQKVCGGILSQYYPRPSWLHLPRSC